MSFTNIGIIAEIVATLLAVITATVILTRRFTRMENRVDSIREGLNQNIRHSNNILGLLSTLIGILSQRNVLDKKDFGKIIKEFSMVEEIREVNPNPITTEQTERLNGYIRRAKEGGNFTTSEVQEYNSLVKMLEAEHPNDTAIMALVALGVLLLGLYLLNKD
jgi:hypothetical protein